MLNKNRVYKQLENVVTIVFYTVMFALLLIIASSFFKAIHTRHVERTEMRIMTSGELPVITPAHNPPSAQLTTVVYEPIVDEAPAVPAAHKSVMVFPCEVTVIQEPIEAVSAETNVAESREANQTPVFSVPLDAELQNHILKVCETYQVDPALVVSIIKRESDYNHLAVGDNGASEGLMQIKRQYQGERMARLGCNDLLDPKQNILVGVDLIAELLNTYETTDMALMAYNAGATGAHTYWFSNGIYSTEYSRSVLDMTAELHHQQASQTVKFNLARQELISVE